ncbi:Lipase class 3 family protein [Seminavis robusta]|uniref:Lipase class 3 family protein n=1 Tax=Seminavis robusta TaxID=568900 RepID=A0A9N8F1J8_9STRA|nr:Lipase class 3 family protein [Seminavis robusta]|eukprot:Sro2811_g337620.1 Lipase class 3 family protein (645) ;mRNA; r:3747-5681
MTENTTYESLDGKRCAISVLEDSMFGFACADIIYLYADLRLLSATGYTSTPFDQLTVDSDAYFGRIPAGRIDLQLNGRKDRHRRTNPANMLLSLLQELQQEAARCRDSQVLEAQEEKLNGALFAVRRRRQSASLVRMPAGVSPSNTSESNKSGNYGRSNAPCNPMLDCIEMILKSSMKHDPSKPSTCFLKDLNTGCCLKQYFHLQYSQLLLSNLYRDAKNAGLYDSKEMPTTTRQTDDGVQDGALFLLEEAIHAPSDAKISQILQSQFKEKSIASQLMSDSSELVWFHDYFPSHEAVFGILVDYNLKVIHIVFRGTVTVQNWMSNLKFHSVVAPNPIPEDYPNKKEHFNLHDGFQSYILRQRLDTHQQWYETVCDLVHYYGNSLLGGTYRMTVSGHSLGGACATLMGFYASTDPRMTLQGPVVIQSFAAPMVGCHSFADAFRHQETVGKLRHARFFNESDIVPRLPLNVKFWEARGSPWAHTGLGIELFTIHDDSWSAASWCKWVSRGCRRRTMDSCLAAIKYAARKDYWEALWDALCGNLMFHLDIFNTGRNHIMLECQARMQHALLRSVDDGLDCWTKLSLDDLYQRHLKGQEAQVRDPYAKLKATLALGTIAVGASSVFLGRWIYTIDVCAGLLTKDKKEM